MAGKIVLRADQVEPKTASVKFGEIASGTRYERDGVEVTVANGVQAIGSFYVQKSALQIAFGGLPPHITITIEAQ